MLTVKTQINRTNSVKALIDKGLQLNLLSLLVAKENNLDIKLLPKLLAEELNRSNLTVYRITLANVSITDSCRHVQEHKVLFVVTELLKYKMYLGLL
jgi:hypothetical protein